MATQLPQINFPKRGKLVRDDFVTAQETAQDLLSGDFTTKFNVASNEIEVNKDKSYAYSLSASNSSNLAQQASLSAQGSANFKGVWSSKGYSLGESVLGSDNVFYVCLATHSSAQNPTTTSGYWQPNVPMGAIGNINSPLLDLPLQNSLQMKAGVGSVTFTRSTTGTYIDRYGVLQTAAIDEPRFEKDGLLIEGSSTNLLTYGDEFDNAAWLKARCSISINSTTAPDGTTTADKLIDTADNNTHILYRDVTVPVGTSTMSIYVKSAEHTKCQVRAYNSTDGYTTANVDIALGITDSGDIAALGDGWYRVSLPKTTTVTTFSFRIYIVDSNGNNVYAGNGTDGIYIWGSQLEALPFASSYIPTTTSAVTRGGDVCKITRYNNSNSSFGDATTHIKFKYKGSNASSTLGWLLRDGSPMYSAFIRDTGYGSLREGSISNEYIIPFNETTSLTTTNNNSNISLYKNGILESTDTGLPPSAGESFIYVGSDQAGNGSMYGHISHIIKYQLALTATEVALLG